MVEVPEYLQGGLRLEEPKDELLSTEEMAEVGQAFYEPTLPDVAQQFGASATRGLAEIPASFIEGMGLISEGVGVGGAKGAHKFANGIRGLADSLIPEVEELRESFITDVGAGVGSGVGFLAGGAAGMLAKIPQMATSAGLGAIVSGAAGYYDTLYSYEDTESDKAQENAWKSFMLNGAVGSTEALGLGRLFHKINKRSGGNLSKLLLQQGLDGVEEAGQEAFQTAMGNLIRDYTTDEEVDLMEGVVRGAGAGFFSSLILGGVLAARTRPKGQPGIEIDEDFQERVQEEREFLERQEGEAPPSVAEARAAQPVPPTSPAESETGKVYHGTGADFEEFSTEAVGSGQGTGSFGHGLYFTESKEIAEFYKSAYPKEGETGAVKTLYLKPKPSELIDWDASLGEQSEFVRERLRSVSLRLDPEAKGLDDDDPVQRTLSQIKVSLQKAGTPSPQAERALSAELLRSGVKGTRYESGQIQGGGDGKNFVIFDPRDIAYAPEGWREAPPLKKTAETSAEEIPAAEEAARPREVDASPAVEATPIRPAPKSAATGQTLDAPATSYPTRTYTSDVIPEVSGKKGAFRRTKADTPKAILKGTKSAIAARRAFRDGKNASDTDDVYKVTRDLARRLGLGPVGLGRARLLKKWAAGFYDSAREAIRQRRGSQFTTFAHEVGHHIHKVLFPRSTNPSTGKPHRLISAKDFEGRLSPEAIEELRLLGHDLYKDQVPRGGYASEGWAEFARYFLADDAPGLDPGSKFKGRAHLRSRAPNLYREVMDLLVREQPELLAILKEAKVRLKNATLIAEKHPYKGAIYREEKDKPKPNWRNPWDSFRRKWTFEFSRIERLLDDLGLEGMNEDESPVVAASRAQGLIAADIRVMTERGRFDPGDRGRRKTGKSVREILHPVRDRLEDFEEYLVARRVLEKRAQGYDVFGHENDAGYRHLQDEKATKEFIADMEKLNPEFSKAAQEFQEFNRWLVSEYAVHYGLISEKQAEQIIKLNMEYVTFRHKKTEDALTPRVTMTAKKQFTGKGSGIRRFRGGMGEQIFPPLASFHSHMEALVTNAQLNRVAQQVTGIFETGFSGAGAWMDRIDRPQDATKIRASDLSSEVLKQLGIVVDEDGNVVRVPPNMDEDTALEMAQMIQNLDGATFFKPGNRTDKENREVTVLRGGKPQFYEIKDPMLFDTLEGLGNPQNVSALSKITTWPRRAIVKLAVRANPSFAVSNFARDFIQAMTYTEASLKKLPEEARLRAVAMRQAFAGGKYQELFEASGADLSSIFNEYYNEKTKQIDWDKLLGDRAPLPNPFKGPWTKKRAKEAVKSILTLQGVERFNEMIERTNRLGEFAIVYESRKASGATENQAIAAAAEAAAGITLDFSRGGVYARQLNQVIPFFNAAILGTARLATEIQKHPARAAARVFSYMVVPSIIEFALNYDNEDYWAKPFYERDRYWWIPVGRDDGGSPYYMKVPKPYGIGAFAILTERGLARMAGIDPGTGKRGDKQAFKDFGYRLRQEFLPDWNIGGIETLFEINAGDQGYSFWLQRPIVPSADKDLPAHMRGKDRSSPFAQWFGKVADVAPAKVDYMIGAYSGGLFRDAAQLGRLAGFGDKGEPLEIHDYMILRKFMGGETRGSHQAIGRFYDMYQHLKGVRTAEGRLEGDELKAWIKDNQHSLFMWPVFSSAQKKMGEEFRELRRLYRDAKIEPDELESRIDDGYRRIIELAQGALTIESDRR